MNSFLHRERPCRPLKSLKGENAREKAKQIQFIRNTIAMTAEQPTNTS